MAAKILALADALGNLVRFVLLPGRFDTVGVEPAATAQSASSVAGLMDMIVLPARAGVHAPPMSSSRRVATICSQRVLFYDCHVMPPGTRGSFANLTMWYIIYSYGIDTSIVGRCKRKPQREN